LSNPPYVFDVTGGRLPEGWLFLQELAAELCGTACHGDRSQQVSFQCPVKSFNENSSFSTEVQFLQQLRDSIYGRIEGGLDPRRSEVQSRDGRAAGVGTPDDGI